MSNSKAQHLKCKSRAAKATHPDQEGFVPSKEFTQMILDEQKNREFHEVDVDDLIAELRWSARLARHMEGLKASGRIYLAQTGAPQDEEGAITWLLRAEARGDTDAQYRLGVMYATRRPKAPTEPEGLRDKLYADADQAKKDDAEALSWFIRAAERGHSDSALVVGLMYGAGRGCRRDPAEAADWIQKAARLGSDAALEHLGTQAE